jgi:hypothetical protein
MSTPSTLVEVRDLVAEAEDFVNDLFINAPVGEAVIDVVPQIRPAPERSTAAEPATLYREEG